jgi:hypothetical protein
MNKSHVQLEDKRFLMLIVSFFDRLTRLIQLSEYLGNSSFSLNLKMRIEPYRCCLDCEF